MVTQQQLDEINKQTGLDQFPSVVPSDDVLEFDADELAKFVAKALGENSGKHAIAFGDTQIIAALSEILPEYLTKPDVAAIFDRVRTALYKDLDFGGLRQLHTAVKHCRACPLVRPEPQLPIWNKTDPDVVFVCDLPWSGNSSDKHMVHAVQAAGFKSRRICYTSVARCFPKEKRAPSVEEISNCSKRYLFSELQQMNPSLIVACGSVPATVLVGSPISVTEERGTIFWLGPWPVLVTLSSGYAMHSELAGTNFAIDLGTAYNFTYGETP